MGNKCCSNKRMGHTHVPTRGDDCPIGILHWLAGKYNLVAGGMGAVQLVCLTGENQLSGVVFPQGRGHCRWEQEKAELGQWSNTSLKGIKAALKIWGLNIQMGILYNEVYRWNGKGNGTPLQYFCLENPMDGGAWWAAVHGVAKSRTRLSDFTFTFHFHALEKEMATHCSVLAWTIPGTGKPGRLPSLGSHRVRHDWSDLAAAAAAQMKSNHFQNDSDLFWQKKKAGPKIHVQLQETRNS